MLKIFAIVVTYNGMRWYDRCLGSLRDSETKVETIVIDNASSDESVAYIREHFPDTHMIESKENLGFAKANNIGIRYAIDHDADYVFLLNQDAWVEHDTLTELLQTFEDNENVGIASPIHLNGSYDAFDRNFVGCMSADIVSDMYFGRLRMYYEVPFVNAAAWLVSVACINRVGGFDTSLFVHYGEDDNYCQRLQFHGFMVLLNTGCTICHDREFRKDSENKYREKMTQKNPFLDGKVLYGDINRSFDFSSMIKSRRHSIVKSVLRCSPKRIKRHSAMIKTLKEIETSRKINMKGGLVWL